MDFQSQTNRVAPLKNRDSSSEQAGESSSDFSSRTRACRDVREILLPFLSEFVGRLAGQLFPQVVAISALAHRRIHLRDDIRVIVLAHLVEEVCGGAITRVVSGAIRITNDGPV